MASIPQELSSFDFASLKPHPGRLLSEDEFLAWCDEDVRAEWVDGEVIVMSPASWVHAKLSRLLIGLLGNFVETKKLGEVVGTEFTVRLNSNRRRIPDVLFIANDRLPNLQPKHLEGAPNLIIEVVSDDSVDRDWRTKYQEYEASGVDEYWIVDPLDQRLEAYAAGDDKTYQRIVPHAGKVASGVVPGFYLRPEWLWQQPLPTVQELLCELLA
ncbi:MAG TPA: Uma2 family endonuclease [Pirellulales bacterium]|nr:Uma2 family endonuclease [Pirellulales bacterium]